MLSCIKKLRCTQITIPDHFCSLELCCFDIHIEIFHFRFFNVCSKPAASSERTNYISQLVKCLSQYYLSDGTNIIVGDMNNSGDIDWVNLLVSSDSVQDVFLKFAVGCGYSHLITNPTRGNKILDVLLASEPLSICDVTVMQPFSNSDHSQVGFKVFVEPLTDSPKAVPRAFRCWEAGNYAQMSRYLSLVNWDEFFSVNFTADAIWDGFCDILNTAVEQFIPVKITVQNSTKKQIKHYPCSIKKP